MNTPTIPMPRIEPNNNWEIDCRGTIQIGERQRWSVLTLADVGSHYLLRVLAMPKVESHTVWSVLESAFLEFGMPLALRIGAESPFDRTTPGGVTKLSVWLTRLGIRLEQIVEPRQPEHRLFVADIVGESADKHYEMRRRALLEWQCDWNALRPRADLGMRSPLDSYTRSHRCFPLELPKIQYDDTYHLRRVDQQGYFGWRGRRQQLGLSLTGEWIGLRERDKESMDVFHGSTLLGRFSLQTGKLTWASSISVQ